MSEKVPQIGFISLGCPKALVDSERILSELKIEGYAISDSYQDADMVIVNTCGFIDQAKAESLETIREAVKENGKVIVTGCMGKKEEDIAQIPSEVLAVTGPQQYEEVMDAVKTHLPYSAPKNEFIDLVPDSGIKLTPKHYAYLKISEGCNHRCSFCIIPSLRGDLVSRPVDQVLDEAQSLVDSGVRELLIISQDTSAYGIDTKYQMQFWEGKPVKTRMLDLAKELGNLNAWVRYHYVYPYPHVDDIIPLMAEGLATPYLDIPFQHASHDILKAMKRPAASEKVLQRINKWRDICPDIALRSTFIVGFPGETEAHFQELLDFLEEAQLDRAGCFTYSAVEGASANALPDWVDEEIKLERQQRFMEVQERISASKLQQKVGQTVQVIVDQVDDDGQARGRTIYDAPEIDGTVSLGNDWELFPGDIIEAKITAASSHDLTAEPVGEE